LLVNPCRHYVSEALAFAAQTETGDMTEKSRSRKPAFLPRAARASRVRTMRGRASRHVAKGAGESLRHFRTLYRPARKRQRATSRFVLLRRGCPNAMGRASRRPHSVKRTGAGTGPCFAISLRKATARARFAQAKDVLSGQGRAVGARRRDVVCRHRLDRTCAGAGKIHAWQNAGEEKSAGALSS